VEVPTNNENTRPTTLTSLQESTRQAQETVILAAQKDIQNILPLDPEPLAAPKPIKIAIVNPL
jgi:hypothetical protein